jgi:DNA-binding CsgD family transcriptional regulator
MVWRIEALADGGQYVAAQVRADELALFVGEDNAQRLGSVLTALLRAQAPTLARDEVVRRTWAALAACLDSAAVVTLVRATELAAELATSPPSRRALMAAANGWRAKYSMRRPDAVAARLVDTGLMGTGLMNTGLMNTGLMNAVGADVTDRDDLALAVARMFLTTTETMQTETVGERSSNNGAERSLSLVQPLVDALTPRELEVLELVAEGLRDKEIATRLYLSVRTVNGYVARVFTKLGASSRLSAVNAARRLGLIDLDGGLVSAS